MTAPVPPGSKCQEASMASRKTYIPCGAPAAFIVQNKDPNPYVMCAACADHNVKNRGARIIEKGERHKPIAVIDAPRASRMRADGAGKKVDKSDALARIMAMVEVMQAALNKVAIASDALRKVQEEASQIENVDLPELLKELKIKDIGLPDGGRVELIEDLKVGISVDNKGNAFAWVRGKGDGGIIKVKIVTDVGNDDDGEAAKLAERIGKVAKGLPVILDESIHYQTLKAYVKEQRAKGVNVPVDLFGIHVFNKAKLTPPKKRK